MSEKKVKTTQSIVKINGKDKKGLITKHAIELANPNSDFDTFLANIDAIQDDRHPRELVLDQIEVHEKYARSVAHLEGWEHESTLDSVATVKNDNGHTFRSSQNAHTFHGKDSVLHRAYMLERQTVAIKKSISEFENYCSDQHDIARFYTAILETLKIADCLWLLTIQKREKEILRGTVDNFYHKTASSKEKKHKAVSDYFELRKSGESKNKSLIAVGKENGKSKTTIRNWVDEDPRSNAEQ